jgi:copper(I)-binding protein
MIRTGTLAALLALAGVALAGGHMEVSGAWARSTPPVSDVGAAYLRIHNAGDDKDRLLGVSSPVAERTEMHTTTSEGGMMKMRPLGAVDIEPGAEVSFHPGGHHLMLVGLKHPLKEGDRFPLTLTFEHAGTVRVDVEVRGMAALHGAEAMDHATMKHEHEAGHAEPAGDGQTMQHSEGQKTN